MICSKRWNFEEKSSLLHFSVKVFTKNFLKCRIPLLRTWRLVLVQDHFPAPTFTCATSLSKMYVQPSAYVCFKFQCTCPEMQRHWESPYQDSCSHFRLSSLAVHQTRPVRSAAEWPPSSIGLCASLRQDKFLHLYAAWSLHASMKQFSSITMSCKSMELNFVQNFMLEFRSVTVHFSNTVEIHKLKLCNDSKEKWYIGMTLLILQWNLQAPEMIYM